MISYGAIRGASSGIYATEVTFPGKPSPKVAGDHPRWQLNCPTRAVHPACTLVLPGRTLPGGRGCLVWPIEHSGVIGFAPPVRSAACLAAARRISAPHTSYIFSFSQLFYVKQTIYCDDT